MARNLNIIGEIGCDRCGERVPVKEKSNGMAGYNCQWCGWQGDAHGKKADQHVRDKMTAFGNPVSDKEPEPAANDIPPAAPAPAPQPKATRKTNMWGL
jgi:DNA-directed RNA polymerase subunit RPC12/RpoP